MNETIERLKHIYAADILVKDYNDAVYNAILAIVLFPKLVWALDQMCYSMKMKYIDEIGFANKNKAIDRFNEEYRFEMNVLQKSKDLIE